MPPPTQIAAVSMAPDASWAVTVSADGTVRTWGVRRYDPAAGTSDMTGAGPGIDLVAVTPDGETVIAAKTEGVLSRLDLSGTEPPGDPGPLPGRLRLLGTAITAITVDDRGRLVLAGRPDGTLWLHDLAGGPAE